MDRPYDHERKNDNLLTIQSIMGLGAFGLSFVKAETAYIFLSFLLMLLGAGSIATMTSRTTVVMNAVPPESSGAASAINAATIKFGSTLGDPLINTLFLSFARKDYLVQMSPTGLSLEKIREATAIWRKAASQASSIDASVLAPDLVDQIASSFRHALSLALDHTMLFMGCVCLTCAGLVSLGLRGSEQNRVENPGTVQ